MGPEVTLFVTGCRGYFRALDFRSRRVLRTHHYLKDSGGATRLLVTLWLSARPASLVHAHQLCAGAAE
jgi:hypothetical protein